MSVHGAQQTPSTGVVFRPQNPPERLAAVAAATQDAGVAELWVWEDCFLEAGPSQAVMALATTEHLRVGIGLLPVALRNPALAAMEVATISRLFPGRLVAGLGHGVADWMRQVGAAVESPMTLLAEHVSAVRALLRGDRVDVDGRYVHLDGVELGWPPSPPPPLVVGARGPKTLRLAGELADGVILDSGTTAGGLRSSLAHVEEGRAAGGRDDPFEVVVYVEPAAGLDDGSRYDAVARAVDELGGAGATSVVFVPPPDPADPRPLLEVLHRLAADEVGRAGAGRRSFSRDVR